MAGTDKARRRLRVTRCEPIQSFPSRFGGERTLHRVEATNEAGTTLAVQLRSFDELPIGELHDYDVERYENERYGVSFTLSLPRERSGARAAEQLSLRVDALEGRVERLEQACPAAPAPAGARFGDAPPF